MLCLLALFFSDTGTAEIYTLSLHDALPIWDPIEEALLKRTLEGDRDAYGVLFERYAERLRRMATMILPPSYAAEDVVQDRKSTRLNSSHSQISYAVFCLKKKKSFTHLPEHC